MRDWKAAAVRLDAIAAAQARRRALTTRILTQRPRMNARDVVAAFETLAEIERKEGTAGNGEN